MAGLIAIAVVIILAMVVISVVGPIIGLIFTIGTWILIGYLAGQVVRGQGYGPLGDAALGLVGGIIGGILFGIIGLGSGGLIGTIASGVVGALVLVYAVRLLRDEKFAS